MIAAAAEAVTGMKMRMTAAVTTIAAVSIKETKGPALLAGPFGSCFV